MPALKALAALVETSEAEQVERERVVQVELLLHRGEVDDAGARTFSMSFHVLDAGSLHRFAGALQRAPDAGSPTNMWWLPRSA